MRSKGSITQLVRNQRPDSLEAADFRAISVGDLVVYEE